MKKKIIIEIIVFLFVVLFLYAAGSKLFEYNKFISQMGRSPILTTFAPLLAWLVPVLEIVISIMLLILPFRLIGMYSAFALMFIFTLYIAAILTFSKELPCACGGVLSMLGWKNHLIFNAFFTFLGLTGIFLVTKGEGVKNASPNI